VCGVVIALLACLMVGQQTQQATGQTNTYDACLSVSYAGPTVTTIRGLLPTTGSVSNATAFNVLWQSYNSSSFPFFLGAYVGLANGDFFGIFGCRFPEATPSLCYIAGTPLVWVERSTAIFGDQLRRFYALSTNGTVGGLVGVETQPYNTTGRPWYLQANGWTAPYLFFGGGGEGQTLCSSFPGGVIGVDRQPREPCDSCLSSAWAFSSVFRLSNYNIAPFYNINSQDQIYTIVNMIFTVFKQTNRHTFSPIALYIGFPNSDFYSVQDCLSPGNKGPICSRVPSRYATYIRNQKLFNTTAITALSLRRDGTLGTTNYNSNPATYNTTGRPWFLQQNGWTSPYSDFTTGTTDRTYTRAVRGGAVVGGDYETSEPCDGAGRKSAASIYY